MTAPEDSGTGPVIRDHRRIDPVTGQPWPFATVQADYNAKKSDATKFGGVAIGMYAAAAVGAGVATYLFISSSGGKAGREKKEARLRLVPVLDHRNAGLIAGLEF